MCSPEPALPDLNSPTLTKQVGRSFDDLGLRHVDDDFRMRLGPPVLGFHPQLVYKVLTPAVG